MKTPLKLNQDWVDPQALKIVQSLQAKGHTTYLVGGCVRDLLLGLAPKDFDIATSALPKEVNRAIRPSHIIGRRFRLVLVRRHGNQYEVSTFRSQAEIAEDHEGPILDDNVFGTPKEDALRRDFTINGLFYDPIAEELIDYTQGLDDIKKGVLRMIGDPWERIAEDPLRMLRALRFSHRTGFTMDSDLRQAIGDSADKLPQSVLPRRREEFLKILRSPSPGRVLWEADDLNLLNHWAPTLRARIFADSDKADSFIKTLNRANSFCQNFENTRSLFGNLLFSIFATDIPNFLETLKVKQSHWQNWAPLIQEELSLFKSEQEAFERSLKLVHQLRQVADGGNVKKKYMSHILRQPYFSRAIELCAGFSLLPPQALYFWLESYWQQDPARPS